MSEEKKIGIIIYRLIVGIVCILLGLGIYFFSDSENYIEKLALVLIIFVFSIKKTINMNIFLRMLRIKKKIDLNKIFFLLIVLAASTTFIAGRLYNHFCTEKIAAREQHLIAVSQMLTPPENAVKVYEKLSHKAFDRVEFVEYTYENSTEKVIRHYMETFQRKGYKIEMIGKKEIEGSKDGVIVNIRYESNKIFIYLKFDDIFEKWKI